MRGTVVVRVPRPHASSRHRPSRLHARHSRPSLDASKSSSIRSRRRDATRDRDGGHTVTSHDPSIDRLFPRRPTLSGRPHHSDTPSRAITRGLSSSTDRSIDPPPIQSQSRTRRAEGPFALFTHTTPRGRGCTPPPPTPPHPSSIVIGSGTPTSRVNIKYPSSE